MKRVCASMVLLLSALIMSGNSYSQDEFPVPDGPYLGQMPPGSTPEVFAPGIVNTEAFKEVEGMFAADMKAFYFIRVAGTFESRKLVVIQSKNNRWSESVVRLGVSEPSLSPDGKTVYLKREYIERTDAGWSALKSLGAPFKDIDIMRLSASANGTYYFDTWSEQLDIPVRTSRLIDGKYEQPKSLGPQFAIGSYNAHPFIAPDDSYIMVYCEDYRIPYRSGYSRCPDVRTMVCRRV